MASLFLKLLNMSIAASWLILAVVVLRVVLKRAPKWIHCILWALVGIRLLCPFSIESALSLIPSSEPLPPEVVQFAPHPAINSGVTIIDNTVNPVIGKAFAPSPVGGVNPLYVWTYLASIVWFVGVIALVIYAVISYLRLRRVVCEAVRQRDQLYLCDHIQTPFILGVIRPRIYLPSDMNEAQMQSVIAHEQAHLSRHDHWWKPLGWAILTVYWFNPFCWVAYILLCRDIELACDEKVICNMDVEAKKAYSMALLSCSIPRRLISACPLAFGEVGVKERIKGVLNYKKPAFWIVAVAVIACVGAAVCFLTNPKEKSDTSDSPGLPSDASALCELPFTLTEGRTGTLHLYGKETSEYFYGISDVKIVWDDGAITTFSTENAMRDYWAEMPELASEYTEAPLTDGIRDGGIQFGDFNFDGYTDIGLQAQQTAYNKPYVYWFYVPDSGEFQYHGDYICPLEPISEIKECVVNYRDGQTYYQDHYAVNEGHNLVLYQRDIIEYVDGKPVTRYESMPQESRGSFENLFGLSGYYIDTSTDHLITRTYYVPVENDGGHSIAESFGFAIDDYIVDLDGDGVTELVCNCQYGGDGHESVYVYRRNGTVIERGWLNWDASELLDFKDWGVNATRESYDPESGFFMLDYDTNRGDFASRAYHYKDFTFEEYAQVPKQEQVQTPISADNFFASMPGTFHFLSGAGGWQTELYWHGDGTFSGIYEDADAGAQTLYRSVFTGRMNALKIVGEREYSAYIAELNYEKPGVTTVENGFSVITTSPYGLDDAEEIRIYLPGYPVSKLPMEALNWLRGGAEEFWDGQGPKTLPFFVLYNIRGQQAFFSADWSAFSGATSSRPEQTDLTFVVEGLEESVPVYLFRDLEYSLYIPHDGWQYHRMLEHDMLAKCWTSTINPAVSLTVRHLGYRDLADAQEWEREQNAGFQLIEDKRGGIGGTDGKSMLEVFFYSGQNAMYAVELRYPVEATEGFGTRLHVIQDTFQVSNSGQEEAQN